MIGITVSIQWRYVIRSLHGCGCFIVSCNGNTSIVSSKLELLISYIYVTSMRCYTWTIFTIHGATFYFSFTWRRSDEISQAIVTLIYYLMSKQIRGTWILFYVIEKNNFTIYSILLLGCNSCFIVLHVCVIVCSFPALG